MSDREPLELAAKAAGVKLVWWNNGEPAQEITINDAGDTTWESWNPLTDDGDVLRLAVKLGLDINCYTKTNETSACLYHEGIEFRCIEKTLKDPYAATRRAIVRAAAEIGKTL